MFELSWSLLLFCLNIQLTAGVGGKSLLIQNRHLEEQASTTCGGEITEGRLGNKQASHSAKSQPTSLKVQLHMQLLTLAPKLTYQRKNIHSILKYCCLWKFGKNTNSWAIIQRIKKTPNCLAIQRLRIHLPMQGTWIRSLVQDDFTCHSATKPAGCNKWSPHSLEPELHKKGSHWNEKPTNCN